MGEVPVALFNPWLTPILFFFFSNIVFKDKNTPSPFIETFPEDDEAAMASKPDHIYMDAMGFGMGNCCLQVLAHSQRLVLSPTFLYNLLYRFVFPF